MLSMLLLLNLECFGILFLISIVLSYPFSEEEYNWVFKNSDLNFWMMMLVIVVFLIMLMIDLSYKTSMNFLFIILLYTMIISNLISFFLMYEMVFLLIMFSIILLGYSFERLMAVFMMMFYSFVFSSPSLLMLLMYDCSFLMKEWLVYSSLMNYFLISSFMVKFPIFGFHYWLPIAHVEASTAGSMVLAGILLKLGSVGLLYVVSFMKFMVKFHWISVGFIIVMMMILSMSDLKIMIAYSSVAHMSMVFYVLMLGSLVGKKGALYMMFYHGYISPLMFWIVGILGWWKTRSIMVVKLMSFSYLFLLCLFMLCIMNMGFPPFMGFMSEVLMFKSLVVNNFILSVMILGVLFSSYYNIYLFWCFSGFMGMVFKMNFFMIDMFMFLLFILFINF